MGSKTSTQYNTVRKKEANEELPHRKNKALPNMSTDGRQTIFGL